MISTVREGARSDPIGAPAIVADLNFKNGL
ncbi:MAG: hypothetical protein JWP21_1453 [Tardiphaga sp.]|jgi:hypothetical protein|nr:hypothetical protein [Tardiphaga sp.]